MVLVGWFTVAHAQSASDTLTLDLSFTYVNFVEAPSDSLIALDGLLAEGKTRQGVGAIRYGFADAGVQLTAAVTGHGQDAPTFNAYGSSITPKNSVLWTDNNNGLELRIGANDAGSSTAFKPLFDASAWNLVVLDDNDKGNTSDPLNLGDGVGEFSRVLGMELAKVNDGPDVNIEGYVFEITYTVQAAN